MAATTEIRRVRPTLRLLREDERVPVPPIGARLDDIDLPFTRKAHDLAPVFPANQIRILELGGAFVFRFTHGRTRVLTWLDEQRQIMWLVGADLRREDEDYDRYLDLDRRDELLPGAEDETRLEGEELLQLAHWIQGHVPDWVAQAQAQPTSEHPLVLPGGAQVIIFASADDEVWVALPTLLAAELGIADPVRSLIVATVTQALGGAAATEWEPRHDWPTGRDLRSYEIAYVWVR
jgi:hypothetical protein